MSTVPHDTLECRLGDDSPKYYVETWDIDLQEFTPQKGCRKGPYSKWGLRKALRKLRSLGYTADYCGPHCTGDPYVRVYRKPA